jgi:hypothetical protein
MNALRKSLNLVRECKWCKNNMWVHIEDVFTPFQNTCLNCSRYLIESVNIRGREQRGVKLRSFLVCEKCALPNERFDCTAVNNSSVCTCRTNNRCECCKICKNTVSFEIGYSAHYESRCSKCGLFLIHMYRNIIFDKSITSLHTRVSSPNFTNIQGTYRGYNMTD